MLIVPVIDIKGGQAVQAVGGMRDRYGPVTTAIFQGSDPAELLEAYLGLYPFPTIYLADLDAIMGRGNNRALIDALTVRYERPVFWLDAGFGAADELPVGEPHERLRIVLGSESLASLDAYTALRTACQDPPILSLDFRDGRFLGPEALWHSPELWPEELILMTLDRVGSGAGPTTAAWPLHVEIGERRRYAAGGVRDPADLQRLEALGYSGALMASALLGGGFSSAELAAILES